MRKKAVVRITGAAGPKPHVLVCAPSNAALDEIVARLLRYGLLDRLRLLPAPPFFPARSSWRFPPPLLLFLLHFHVCFCPVPLPRRLVPSLVLSCLSDLLFPAGFFPAPLARWPLPSLQALAVMPSPVLFLSASPCAPSLPQCFSHPLPIPRLPRPLHFRLLPSLYPASRFRRLLPRLLRRSCLVSFPTPHPRLPLTTALTPSPPPFLFLPTPYSHSLACWFFDPIEGGGGI